MRLSVVIPAYQAATTLPRVLPRIPPAVDARVSSIYVVDDGSVDDTAAVAGALARGDARVRVLRHRRNRGYGGAMKTGLTAARADGAEVVACLHADGQYAPESLEALLSAVERDGLDLVQGSRMASGTARSGGMPLYKYVAGRGLTLLENRVLGLGLSDYHSGYLVYGPRTLAAVPFGRLSDGFEFDLEVIASARARDLAVGERPIPTHYGDEVSHLSPVRYGLRVLGVMLRYLRGDYDAG